MYRSWTPLESQTGEALSGTYYKIRRTLGHDPTAQAATTAAPTPAYSHLPEPVNLSE
ncbi:hypothetical protein [Deinococcus sp. QL22]|uniref:hypothetical protein n=1 Tax=Deinococcus sp. QL22 TaxID=2939437 RepID=UPI0020176979|nr:hypothetical protein [Deinococcus sp. QL22]UQN08633.1 hypothetical protein M1R55_21125 [Deinococcus sp. QL22]